MCLSALQALIRYILLDSIIEKTFGEDKVIPMFVLTAKK